jgi:hypothetical protein
MIACRNVKLQFAIDNAKAGGGALREPERYEDRREQRSCSRNVYAL